MHEHNHWHDAQHEEKSWWGDCANTMWEETKQLVYAKNMGLSFTWDAQGPYSIYKEGLNILDIGGGPSSLLLKTKGANKLTVSDPCDYPEWVAARYQAHEVEYDRTPGEEVSATDEYDEVWIYNVLQHTDDPSLIIANAVAALKKGGVLRIFEWTNHPVNTAHPHMLTSKSLTAWMKSAGITKGKGKTRRFNETGCVGEAFYGAFTK